MGGILWALAQGFSVIWYFQGVENLPLAASVETGSRILGTALIFALVRSQNDSWRVLLILGSTALVADVFNLALMYSDVAMRAPRLKEVISQLRAGSTLFLFRTATSYTSVNAFLLGLVWPASTVAYFALPERMTMAVVRLLSPISQVLYPRVSYLLRSSPHDAFRLARRGAAIMACAGALMSIVLYLLAPLMIRLFLGRQYTQAVPVLRILALLPPIIAINTAMGLQWMLPLGLEKSYTRILFCAGALDLLVASTLGLKFAHIGMAWTVVVSEAFIATVSYIMLRRHGLDLVFQDGNQLDPQTSSRESIISRIQEVQISLEAINSRTRDEVRT